MTDDPYSIFQNSKNKDNIPVTIVKNGKRIKVGEAKITDTGDFLHVEMDVKSDDPQDVIDLLGGNIRDSPLSNIPRTNHLNDHRHHPVQHRDNREPWCDICQLTASYGHPKKAMWK